MIEVLRYMANTTSSGTPLEPSKTVASDVLDRLDAERLALAPPEGNGIGREFSQDGKECRIVSLAAGSDDLDVLIAAEAARARREGYSLEWKTYGHDRHPRIKAALRRAGFIAGEQEVVLATDPSRGVGIDLSEDPRVEIRRLDHPDALDDIAAIARASGRTDVDGEQRQLRALMLSQPDSCSLFVAYVEGVAAASGRLHVGCSVGVAELAGGRTIPRDRRRGLYTRLVIRRLEEARDRGFRHVFVDARSSSRPILLGMGFVEVTTTTPYELPA